MLMHSQLMIGKPPYARQPNTARDALEREHTEQMDRSKMANNRQAVGRDKQPRYRQDCHRYDPCVTQPLVRSAAGLPPNWKGADDQGGHCKQKMKLNNQQRD